MRIAAIAVLAFAAGIAASSDDLSKIAFKDGKDRTLADFAGQNVLVLPMNGKC